MPIDLSELETTEDVYAAIGRRYVAEMQFQEALASAINGNYEFAASGKKKNCNPAKSHFCQSPNGAGSCVPLTKKCKFQPTGSAKQAADYVGEKTTKTKSASATSTSSQSTPKTASQKSAPKASTQTPPSSGANSTPPLGLASFASGTSRISPNDIDQALRDVKTDGIAGRLTLLEEFAKRQNISVSLTNYESKSLAPSAAVKDAVQRYQQLPEADRLKDKALLVNDDGTLSTPAQYQLKSKGGSDKLSIDEKIALIRVGREPGSAGYTKPTTRHVVVTPSEERAVISGKFQAEGLEDAVDKAVSLKQSGKYLHQLGGQTKNDDADTVVTMLHELGHQVKFRADEELGLDREFYSTKDGVFIGSKIPGKAKTLTDYGSKSNPDEWFAEGFAAYMLNAKRYKEYDPVGHDYIEGMLTAAARGKDAAGAYQPSKKSSKKSPK